MIYEPLDTDASPADQQGRVDAIVARGPSGAFALAGAATAIVLAIWVIFYIGVFVARGGGN